jgi:hypothetical protein
MVLPRVFNVHVVRGIEARIGILGGILVEIPAEIGMMIGTGIGAGTGGQGEESWSTWHGMKTCKMMDIQGKRLMAANQDMNDDDFKDIRLFGHYTPSVHATHELHIHLDRSSITGWEINRHEKSIQLSV